MSQFYYPNIVIGAGAAGLVIAIGLAKAGKKVLLVEAANFGGDCTNYGCVPSKALIAAAKQAHALKNAKKYGLDFSIEKMETKGALRYCQEKVQHFLAHENQQELQKIGVESAEATASFLDPNSLKLSFKDGKEKIVRGKNIVITTGSKPFIPKIEGLEKIPFLTNESIFAMDEIPKSLMILGAGPIGCEMAQAFSRLGSKITLVHSKDQILEREEKATADRLSQILQSEGIEIFFSAKAKKFKQEDGKLVLSLRQQDGTIIEKSAEKLLIACGRRPNLKSLCLEKAGISFDEEKGIQTDAYGRCIKKHIWAAGDASGGAFYTHMAEHDARVILSNLILPWPLKFTLDSKQAVPSVSYTEPELASIGMREKEAVEKYGEKNIVSYEVDLSKVDRAVIAGKDEGLIKIVSKKWSGKILGASILSPRGGEMLLEISVAMKAKLSLSNLSQIIHPYPAYSRGLRKSADGWLLKTIIPSLKRFFGLA